MEPLSTIPIVVAVVTVMVTGFGYFRSTAAKVWAENAAAWEAKVQLLERHNYELQNHVHLLEARIVELEARPDWESVVRVVKESETRIVTEIRAMVISTAALHQTRAEEASRMGSILDHLERRASDETS